MLKRYILAAVIAGFSASYGMEKELSKTTYVESILGMLKALFVYSVELEDARHLKQEHGLYFSMLPKDILGMVQQYRLHELLDRASRAENLSEALRSIKRLAQLPEYTQVLNNPQFIDGIIQQLGSEFGGDPERLAQLINIQGAGLWLTRIRPNQIKLLQEVKSKNLASVQQLIAAGANINAQDKHGWTVLMWAAYKGHTEIVEELIKAGANVNAQNKDRETALMWAVEKGHTEIVKELIKAGAAVKAQTKGGYTALYVAEKRRNKEIVKLLELGKDI